LVTDSGLGGFSVAARIDSLLRARGCFRYTEVIFCNSLPSADFRYNDQPNMQAKANVFSEVLRNMTTQYHPDIILIACNTLSVVYPNTEYSQTTNIPVLGIVDFGVEMIEDSLLANPQSSAIILGTPTTVSSEMHKEMLIKNGIDSSRIFTLALPNLESEIQADPGSDLVGGLIEFYFGDISDAIASRQSSCLYAALCCTHYGYAKDQFTRIANAQFGHTVIIDPNDAMVRFFEPLTERFSYGRTNSIRVISQARLAMEELQSIGNLTGAVSPQAREALLHYENVNTLFYYKQ
jgi:glutamate racemase